ncbi:unnamed protein product [Closterium sp. NIES-54]
MSSCDVTFDESVCFYCLHPHHISLVPLPPLSLVDDPPTVAPLLPPSPAPSDVSQVDPPPLVEPLEVSLDTSGPAEGGDQTAADTVAPRRSARLVVPPGFPPQLSSPPLRHVAVDSGAAGGGDTGGADSGGGGAGGAGARWQETLSPEWLREWAVRWGSPGGGVGRARAAGSGGTGAGGTSLTGGTGGAGPGGASTGVPGVGRAGGAGAGGTGPTGGTRGAAAVGAAADSPGSRSRGGGHGGASAGVPGGGRAGGTGARGTGPTGGTGGAAAVDTAAGSLGSRHQGSLLPEQLREWAVHWGSPGGGAGQARAAGSGGAGPGGASAGVPIVGHTGGTGAGGTGPTGGTGGAAAVDAPAGSPGSRRQESLSPEQLREWAVRWGSVGGGAGRVGAEGSGGTGLGGAGAGVPGVGRAAGTGTRGTGAAGGTGGAGPLGASGVVPRVVVLAVLTLEVLLEVVELVVLPQLSTLRHLLSLSPAATEFPVASTTPPLLFPPTDQSQPQLLPGSPLPAPATHTEVTEFFSERREPETRPSTPVRGRHVVHPRALAVPGTHCMALRPSSVPQRVVLPSPPASSLPHIPDSGSDLVRTASPTVTRLLAAVVTDPSFESAAMFALDAELVGFAALCRLDYAMRLVIYSSCPPSVGGELALDCDALEDRQFELDA